MNSKVSRLLFAAVGVAVLIVVPLYAFKVYYKTDYTDFFVYYRAALRMKEQFWGLIYTLEDGASPFRYPPILLPLLRPFATLTLRNASLAWYFLQVAWFAMGFVFLHRTAKMINPARAALATALSFFFVLRFCLDTFTIGQVSSFMFFGYCLGLYGYVRGEYFFSGTGLFFPTLFKVGPGFTYLLFPFSRLEQWIRAWLAPLFWTVVLTLLTWAMLGKLAILNLLISRWVSIVQGDGAYYDASHYGSQSVKSVLLRCAGSGWLSQNTAVHLWLALSALGCAAILWIWSTRRARTAEGRALQFTVGIFSYLWFMPETFKYSLTMIALPALLLLLSKERSRLSLVSLIFGFFVLSLAGKDLLPDSVFFGLQRASMPFFATLLIGAAVFRELWRNTTRWSEQPPLLPRPWEQLPHEAKNEGVSVLIPIGDHIPKRECLSVIPKLQSALQKRFGAQWELIWIAPSQNIDPQFKAKLEALVRKFPQSKLLHSSEAGRGFCLREGFLASSGKWIYLYRIEQPVGEAFFEEAMNRLQAGAQLVRANRRDPETRFLIPVKYLNLAYRRHRLGLFFNRLVRLFLPIVASSDTHSGHLLLARSAASEIFALQTSGDFLFDLELSVIARAHGFKESELPVRLYLFEEKTGERILSEIVTILTGLPKIRSRFRAGCYAPLRKTEAITADDWGISPAVNRGILELARSGVIRRVSVMANTQFIDEGLQELRSVPGIQLGMHFTLTYGRALSPNYKMRPAARLLLDWLNPFTNHAELLSRIQEELSAQLRILDSKNIPIAYFDGHHHIHLLPGLINDIAPLIKGAGIRTVRLPFDPDLKFSSRFPLIVLSLLARSSLKRNQFESMKVFYPLRAHFLDHGRFRARLNRDPDAEIIVHPASENDFHTLEFPDSYTEHRIDEYRALRMLAFLQKESHG